MTFTRSEMCQVIQHCQLVCRPAITFDKFKDNGGNGESILKLRVRRVEKSEITVDCYFHLDDFDDQQTWVFGGALGLEEFLTCAEEALTKGK